jgi:hypothetical protein
VTATVGSLTDRRYVRDVSQRDLVQLSQITLQRRLENLLQMHLFKLLELPVSRLP